MIQYAQAIISVILTAIVAFVLHSGVSYFTDIRHAKELSDQKFALLEQCEADKKITYDASKTYQSKIITLNSQLSRLRRVRPYCVPVTPDSPSRHSGTTASGELPGQNGINSQWLFQFAGDAEKERIKLISCQNFLKSERE